MEYHRRETRQTRAKSSSSSSVVRIQQTNEPRPSQPHRLTLRAQSVARPSAASPTPARRISTRPSTKKLSSVRPRTTKRGVNSANTSDAGLNPFRLSTDAVVPSHYTLCIKPRLENFTFEGCVAVTLKVAKTSSIIVLNAVDLSVSKLMWEEDGTERKQRAKDYSIDSERQQLKVTFDPPLPPSDGCIRINFLGVLTDKATGLCLVKHFNVSRVDVPTAEEGPTGPNHDKYDIVTNFEPAFARTCFPCWDEPGIRCTFDISLIVPKAVTAIATTDVIAVYPHRSNLSLHVVEFSRTPPMPPCLLAFAVGHFMHLQMRTHQQPAPHPFAASEDDTASEPLSPVTCRVHALPGREAWGQFAVETCVRLLGICENYFTCAFPLPKLDVVSVTDFRSGISKSWGLTLIDDSRVLLPGRDHSQDSMHQVTKVLANAVVHQWFGGLVGVSWWSQRWVTDALCSFVQIVALDSLDPAANAWTQFYIDTVVKALELGALKNSNSLETLIFHPSEISENMDQASLDKGAAVVAMVQQFVGEEAFCKALRFFLHQYKFQSVSAADLWWCLELVSGKDVSQMVRSWTRRQNGFPLVRVIAIKQHDTMCTLTLMQERFWADPDQRDTASGTKEILWSIPLTFATAAAPTRCVKEMLMDKKTFLVMIENVDKAHWVKLNVGGRGFYRVQYSPEAMLQFQQSIRTSTMPPVDRIGLLNDLFAFTQAGYNSTLELFNFLESYTEEEDLAVWTEIVRTLHKLERLLWDTDFHFKFRSYWHTVMNTILEKLGWNPSSTEDLARMKLRGLVLSRLVLARHGQTLTTARLRFAPHLSGKETAPAELQCAVFQAALLKGIQGDVVKVLLKRFKESVWMAERENIVSSYAAVSDPEIILDLLEFAKSGAMRNNEVRELVCVLSDTRAGREVVWQFFKANQPVFKAWFGQGLEYNGMVQAITGGWTSTTKIVEVFEFFKDKFGTSTGLERAMLQVEEMARVNDAWLKREAALIADFLSTYE